MKKKVLLALCLLASLNIYAQWWSGHADNVVFDETAKKMTITGLHAGELGDIITDGTGGTENLRRGTYTWSDEPDGMGHYYAYYNNDAKIETLVVTGEVNGDDIKIMADMGRNNWVDDTDQTSNDDSRLPKGGGLKHLDISGAKIVAGGGYYFNETFTNKYMISARSSTAYLPAGTYQFSTSDNEIGDMMFFACDKLQSIELPTTATKIGDNAFEALMEMRKIVIPASVTSIGVDAFKWSFDMSDDAMMDYYVNHIIPYTIIEFAEAEEKANLDAGALKLGRWDGPNIDVVAHVNTPLTLLDDYALDAQLQEIFEAGEVKATATPPNKYWTFSNGVDVIVPDNVKVYTCQIVNGETDIRELTDALVVDGKRTIKRNNGVLVACPDDATSNAYELVAKYNADLVGTTPATTNANDYPNNSLVPVLTKSHYEPGEYYMLYHGKWVAMASDATKVPACKALLKK